MQGRSPLLVVCGTRPEAIKLLPLIRELRQSGQRLLLLTSGQHRDLAPPMFAELGLAPDIDLSEATPAVSPEQLLGALIARISPALRACRPALVIVQGDTASTLAGALAAAYAQVPVAHVEAGLRTNDPQEPHPEEMHRRLIATIASLHFAPTERAAANLRAEGIRPERIHVTGNTGIDTLLASGARLAASAALQRELRERFAFLGDSGFLLVTVHRRENIGARLDSIIAALRLLADSPGLPILLPLHPNPAFARPLRQKLGGRAGIHLLPPQDHAAMLWLMRRARLLLTDSGGLQEEAPSLGLRTLILRRATERPEAIDAGASELVSPEAGDIVGAARRMLRLPPLAPLHPFGDGHAAARISAAIVDWLGYRTAGDSRLRAVG